MYIYIYIYIYTYKHILYIFEFTFLKQSYQNWVERHRAKRCTHGLYETEGAADWALRSKWAGGFLHGAHAW